ENDELIAEADRPDGVFKLNTDAGTYHMSVTTDMDQDWSPFTSRTASRWTFHSKEPGEGIETVPLLMLDVDLDLKLNNTASLPEATGGMLPVSFEVEHQPGAEEAPIE